MLEDRGDEKSGWRMPAEAVAPSLEAVQQMLSRWLDGRRVRDVRLLAGGLMNRNCRVRIDGAPGSVVLRLYDRDGSACAKEVAVLELLRCTLPVPHAAIGEAAYDAGRLLARLQTHSFPRTGLLTPALTVDSSFIAGPITTTRLIELYAKSPAFGRRMDPRLLDRLLRLAEEWDAHPRAPDVWPTLTHGDFNSHNVLVKQREGRWVVAAVLDWEFAFAGPVYCDIGNFLRYERSARPRFEPFFSRGCRDGGVDLRGDWLMAARLADLPALCELLARESTPDDVTGELLELITATVAQCEHEDPGLV